MANRKKGVNSNSAQKAFRENSVKSRVELYNLRASKVGCVYLGDENVRASDFASWECSKGHRWIAKPNSIQQGQGCSYCNRPRGVLSWKVQETLKDNNVKSRAELYNLYASRVGCRYLGDETVGTRDLADWECSKGHVFQCKPNSIQQGQGCSYCNSNNTKYVLFRNNCKTPDEYGHKIASENSNGIKYIGGFVDTNTTKAEWECNKGHRWEATPNHIQQGRGCPKCANSFSKKEQALFLEIQKVYPEAINNTRKLLKNTRYELDIFVPSLNKAVEFDGGHWHSFPDAIRRDTEKDIQCTEAGIALYRVKESDWDTDKNAVIKNVLEFLKRT
jgi:very-short-patch-repair endonuclease